MARIGRGDVTLARRNLSNPRARRARASVMAARYLSIESAGKRLHRSQNYTVDLTQKRPGAAYNKHLLPRPTTTHNTRCFRSGTARAASTCMVPSSSSQGHTRPHRSACTARGVLAALSRPIGPRSAPLRPDTRRPPALASASGSRSRRRARAGKGSARSVPRRSKAVNRRV